MSQPYKTERNIITNRNKFESIFKNKYQNNFPISKNNLIYQKNILSSLRDIPINTNVTNSFLKNFKIFENKKSNPSSTSISISTNSTPLKIPSKENNDSIKNTINSKEKLDEYQFQQQISKANEIFLNIQKLILQNNQCLNECVLWIENFRNIYEYLIYINKENEYFNSIKMTLLIMFFSIILIYDIVNQNKQKYFLENMKNIINIHILMSESIYNNSLRNPNINHKEENQVLLLSYKDISNRIFKIITQYQRINLKNFQSLFIAFRKMRNENYEFLYDLFNNKIKNIKLENNYIEKNFYVNNSNINREKFNLNNKKINEANIIDNNITNKKQDIQNSINQISLSENSKIKDKNINNNNSPNKNILIDNLQDNNNLTNNLDNSKNINLNSPIMNNSINTETINMNNIIDTNSNTVISENNLNLTFQPQIKETNNMTIISNNGAFINNSNNYFYFRKPVNIPKSISNSSQMNSLPSHQNLNYFTYQNTNSNLSNSNLTISTNTFNHTFTQPQSQTFNHNYSLLTPQRTYPKFQSHYSNNYYIQNDPRFIIQETIKNEEEENESIFARFNRIKKENKKKEQHKNYTSVQKDNSNIIKNLENNNTTYSNYNLKIPKKETQLLKNKNNQNQNIGTIDMKNLNIINIKEQNTKTIPLIPFPPSKQYSLVLDLDETLIHVPKGKNIFILRPGLRKFLHSLTEYYELIVFTTGIKEYADQIINFIEKDEKYFSYRLYRESATFLNEQYYKDLNKLGRDIKKIIIVDDKEINMELQEENGIIIKPFITENDEGKNDFILYDLINILVRIAKDKPDDIRKSLKIYRNEIYQKISND
jgi:CTD small phosphatase-like protein 2